MGRGANRKTRRAIAAVIESIERRILFAALDPTWAGDGVQHEPYPTQFTGNAERIGAVEIAALSDGKVLTLAQRWLIDGSETPFTYSLVRYNADGSIDTTFGGGDGILPLDGLAHDMVVAADGTIYLARADHAASGGPFPGAAGDERWVEARNPDGSLKNAFAGDGRYDFPLTQVVASNDGVTLALAPDGDVYAAVTSTTRVVKLNPDGSGDAAFDGDGVVDFDPGDGDFNVAEIAAQPTGHVIILSAIEFSFTRIAPNGSVQQRYRPFDSIYPETIAIQADGKILAADGTSIELHPYYLSVGRLNADLSLDTSYGDNGVARSPDTNDATSKEKLDAFAVDQQGRAVIVIGFADERPSRLMRFNADGSFDATVSPDVGLALDIYSARSLAMQEDGNLVVGSYPFAVSRVLSVVEDVMLSGGVLAVRGTSGVDTITIAASGSNIVLTRNGAETTFPASQVQRVSVDGLAGNDTISVTANLPATVSGREGDDSITTAGGFDRIFGGDGHDTISTGNGGDTIDGDAGNDSVTCGDAGVIDGFDQRHLIDGGGGDDTIVTGSGRDSLTGGAGNDRISAGAIFDEIFDQEGNNRIEATTGTIVCGDGDDTIVGGDGEPNDAGGFQFDIHAGDGDNVITTGAGVDWITCGQGSSTISSGAGNDQISTAGFQADSANLQIDAGDGNDLIASNFVALLTAGAGDDRMTVEWANTINGGDGNDQITALQYILGAIDAGAGNDLVRCNSDADHGAVVHGGDGDDSLYTADGRDTIYGGAGRDRIHAGNASDLLNGGGGRDHLFGQGGNDRLYGGRGGDRMDGQGGNDRFRGGEGADRIDGGAGTANAADEDDEDVISRIQEMLS